MTIDRDPLLVPLVSLAALMPERATPFGPHRPLPGLPLTKLDVPRSGGNAQVEKAV